MQYNYINQTGQPVMSSDGMVTFSQPIMMAQQEQVVSTSSSDVAGGGAMASGPSNKNELVINETTSIIEIAPATLQSLGISCSQVRSRSGGSIRSNLTVRSANASIRTNNSIGMFKLVLA